MSEKNGKRQIVRIAMSIPNEGHTQPEAYDNRLQMAFHLGGLQLASHLGIKQYGTYTYDYPENVEFEFYWSSVGRVLTPLARERLTEWALESNMDYMLQVDDDMICPIDMFEKLFKHNVDVVAPLAFMRQPPHKPVMFRIEEGYDPLAHVDYYISHVVHNYPKNKLVECDAVGFGAALIKMGIVKKLNKPFFMSTTSSGEDLWFCKRVREAGGHVYMDTSIKLGHLGLPPIIEEKDYEREFKADDYREVYGDWKGKKSETIRTS